MNALILRKRNQGHTTLIENEFIDNYMVEANGEYVKVYLFLLRHLNNPDFSLNISQIADRLDTTERDIARALRYWEEKGLLAVDYNENDDIIGIEIGKISSTGVTMPVKPKVSPVTFDEPKKIVPATPVEKPVVTSSSESKAESGDCIKKLAFVAEMYLKRTLTRTDMDDITYFHNDLHFSYDLIEYLLEYCVENGHSSMHYIRKVALAWSDEHITTVAQAKESSAIYNKTNYAILNAFGIKGRRVAPAETLLIRKWTDEWAFDLCIILEACGRTISATHQPSFEYTDKILETWFKKGVHSMSDIQALDSSFEKNKSESKNKKKKKNSSESKFHDFEERSYDMDEITKALLK